jgi:hypothetical protein
LGPDLVLLQSIASELPAPVFISTLMDRFEVSTLFRLHGAGLVQSNQLALQQIYHFLISLIAVATAAGRLFNSDQQLIRREIISKLCTADLTYSKVAETMSSKFIDSPELESTLRQVATIDSKGIFRLKPELWTEFDPFYLHYTDKDRSDALERWRAQKSSFVRFANLPSSVYSLPLSTTLHGILASPHLSAALFTLCHNAAFSASPSFIAPVLTAGLRVLALAIGSSLPASIEADTRHPPSHVVFKAAEIITLSDLVGAFSTLPLVDVMVPITFQPPSAEQPSDPCSILSLLCLIFRRAEMNEHHGQVALVLTTIGTRLPILKPTISTMIGQAFEQLSVFTLVLFVVGHIIFPHRILSLYPSRLS